MEMKLTNIALSEGEKETKERLTFKGESKELYEMSFSVSGDQGDVRRFMAQYNIVQVGDIVQVKVEKNSQTKLGE